MSRSFFIDVSPNDTTTWEEWSGAASYVFGTLNLPDVDETEWITFANILQESPALNAYGLPGTAEFTTWREWASTLGTVSNGAGVII